jgi:DNA-binding MarR family transcriptional regulator
MASWNREKEAAHRALARLLAGRAFERAHLPFVVTLEERDLICEIGHRQARGAPLSMKQVFLLGIGSVATVQRRLRRLRRLGAIQQKRREDDRRTVEVTLTPKVLKVFATYDSLLTPDTP